MTKIHEIFEKFFTPFQSFLPHMLMKLVFRKERKIVDGGMDQDPMEKMWQKTLDGLDRRNVYIFGRNMVHHWNTHFGDVLVKKNCNFTNSSLMFIFLFVNETYDTFTFLEKLRRWDFQYFEFSIVDLSPFTCEIFEYVNGIFSEFSFSQDIFLRSIVDCDGIVLMRRKHPVVVYNQFEMILSIILLG